MRQERVLDAFAAMPGKPPHPVSHCAYPDCGVEFSPVRSWQKYHTPNCRKRHWEGTRGRGHQPVAALICPHCAAPLSLVLAPACLPSEARRA